MKKQELSELLLKWYNAHGRTLPWRVKGGAHPDPYVVLVSEFMLQQTTVKTVLDYFPGFLKRFPTAESLAAADLEEVYRYWQGLGYYTRARSLYATAQTVVNEFDGKFPQNREEVLKLKGIGAYTAASFLALAFNLPETVVDGNVIRIICRLHHLTAPVAEIENLIREKRPPSPIESIRQTTLRRSWIWAPWSARRKIPNACSVPGSTNACPAACRNSNGYPTAPNRPKRKKTAASA